MFEAAERLRSGDNLLERVASLWKAQHSKLPSINIAATVSDSPLADYISAKARGDRVRSKWIDSNLGRSAIPFTGTLYKNGRGETFGIAYAKESEKRKGRWFSGLPENKFQSAILLCESLAGKLDAVCLPSDFIAKYRQNFSVSHGQVKFMVVKRENIWNLSVPGIGEVGITENVNKVTLVAY